MHTYTCRAFIILCRSWRKNLHRLVKNSVEKIDIYQILHILLNEQSQIEFHQLLEKFLGHYKQTEPAFIHYFEDYYSLRSGNNITSFMHGPYCTIHLTEKWAMCFRNFDHSDIDTNMHIERFVSLYACILTWEFTACSFHNQLKNNPAFMNGKVNKRVDSLLHLLLKYETNTFFNRKTKELMWKYNRKAARENERHTLGSRIVDKDFKVRKCTCTYVLSLYKQA